MSRADFTLTAIFVQINNRKDFGAAVSLIKCAHFAVGLFVCLESLGMIFPKIFPEEKCVFEIFRAHAQDTQSILGFVVYTHKRL